MVTLCELCNNANNNFFEIGTCFICKNRLDKLKNAITKAVDKLNGIDTITFSISTKIPNDWLIREENVWDENNQSTCESIKNFVNKQIVKELCNGSGKRYSAEYGECRIVFDLNNPSVTITIENSQLFVFGRYKKHSKELSQSRWICKKCKGEGCFKCDYTGKNYTSVEELIGVPFKEATDAEDYIMHASGREDVDVKNKAGRPFVLEIKNPKNRCITLDEIAEKINNQNIEVADLKVVNAKTVELVANSHFDKNYEAVVSFEKEFDAEKIKKIERLSGSVIEQRTPNRVAHRRADLVRKRKILCLRITEQNKKMNTMKVLIEAEAGTYIKEFISGDKDRTKPSIASVVGMKVKCVNLVVSAIYDDFLKIRGY